MQQLDPAADFSGGSLFSRDKNEVKEANDDHPPPFYLCPKKSELCSTADKDAIDCDR